MIGTVFFYNMGGSVGKGKVVSKANDVPYEGEWWNCSVLCHDGTWRTKPTVILQAIDMFETLAGAVDSALRYSNYKLKEPEADTSR